MKAWLKVGMSRLHENNGLLCIACITGVGYFSVDSFFVQGLYQVSIIVCINLNESLSKIKAHLIVQKSWRTKYIKIKFH